MERLNVLHGLKNVRVNREEDENCRKNNQEIIEAPCSVYFEDDFERTFFTGDGERMIWPSQTEKKMMEGDTIILPINLDEQDKDFQVDYNEAYMALAQKYKIASDNEILLVRENGKTEPTDVNADNDAQVINSRTYASNRLDRLFEHLECRSEYADEVNDFVVLMRSFAKSTPDNTWAIQNMCFSLTRVYDCIREWHFVSASLERVHQHVLLGGPLEPNEPYDVEKRRFNRFWKGIVLLKFLSFIKDVRKKTQHSDIMDILSKSILCVTKMSPHLDWLLRLCLDLSCYLVAYPSTWNAKVHHHCVEQFFGCSCGSASPILACFDEIREIRDSLPIDRNTRTYCKQLARFGASHSGGNAQCTSWIQKFVDEYKAVDDQKNEKTFHYGVCAAAYCFNLAPPTSEGAQGFKVCAVCKWAQYCSKQCQKYDWSHGHKDECASNKRMIG